MKLLASIDILRLEALLVEQIARRPHGGLLEPVLVLVPTSRLATHAKRKVAARCGAALGVHVFTHRGFAVRALEFALEPPPRVLADAALLELVEGCAHELRAAGETAAEHLERFPGARAGLLATFKDLREAGIEAGELDRSGDSTVPAVVRRGYASFCAALARLEVLGHTDAPGLARAALPHVGRFLEKKGIRTVYQHGAYELTGAHVELLQACEAAAEVVALLPTELDGPAFGYGARFAHRLAAAGATLETLPAPTEEARRADFIARLRGLYAGATEGSGREPDAAPLLETQTAQGPEDELRAAALRALALHHHEQVPLEEIAIVARTLGPYAPFLEAVLDGLDIPFTSTATAPAGRDPAGSAFIALLRVLEGGFERQATIDLLRRERLRHGEERVNVDLWDRLSREARLTGGLAEWRRLDGLTRRRERHGDREQPGGASTPAAGAGTSSIPELLRILDDLEAEATRWRQARTLAAHGAFLRDLAARRIRLEAGEGSTLARAFDDLDTIVAVQSLGAAGTRSAPGPREALDLLLAVLAGAAEPIHRADEGGVRILDLMQARGLTHRAVIWIGFHHEIFPRLPAPDTWLDDGARERLAATTRKPLASKLVARDEERLLLAMTLASARDRVVISWQRADAGGRQVARSSALREVARLVTGAPDSTRLHAEAAGGRGSPEYVPAHPGQQVAWLGRSPRFGLVPPRVAIAAGAARADDAPAMAAALLARLGDEAEKPAAGAAIACVASLEQFAPGCGAYDGRLGSAPSPRGVLSPSAVQLLAQCPQRFFLRHVLGVREIEAGAVAHDLGERDLGSAAHRLLESVYKTLWPTGQVAWAADTLARALAQLEAAWPQALREVAGAAGERLPALLAAIAGPWLPLLLDFLTADLKALGAEGATRVAIEQVIEATLPLPGNGRLPLRGVADRVLWTDRGALLDDYKSGRGIKDMAKPDRLRTGQHLQLFLYREMAALALEPRPQHVEARYLAIGPGKVEEKLAARGEVPLEITAEERREALETVATAWGLWRLGLFPLHPDAADRGGYCQYCDYRRTCRRSHVPTLERIKGDRDVAPFLARREKQPATEGKPRRGRKKTGESP